MAEFRASHFFETLSPKAHLELEADLDGKPQWLTLSLDGHGNSDDSRPIYGAPVDLTMHFMGGDFTDDSEIVQARNVLEQLRDSAQAALDVLGQGKLDV